MSKVATEVDILPTTKTDVLQIDPRNIEIEEGFNGRQHFPKNEQTELIDSIRANGVQVPILVKKIRGTEKYTLVNGERRWRACMWLIENEGWEGRIKANTFTGSPLDAVVSMLITNDNVPLNMIEEAAVLYRLSKYNLTTKEISVKTGRKVGYITNLLKLHEAPQEIKKLITEGRINPHLVMKVFREEKDFDSALVVIQTAIEGMPSKADLLGENKKKVTEKDINKVKGVTNGYSALKGVFKLAEKKGYLVNPDKKELHKFLSQINSGKKTREQLLNELYLVD